MTGADTSLIVPSPIAKIVCYPRWPTEGPSGHYLKKRAAVLYL